MTNTFYFDSTNESKYLYSTLIHDLNHSEKFYPFCYESDFYQVFKNILLSLILDKSITLLDYDFSEEEIVDLIGDLSLLQRHEQIDQKLHISSVQELIKTIDSTLNWRVNLFTSGTTGKPKMVSHDFENITRTVKLSTKHQKDIWGFAYNPTHIAGIQVFFQSVLNANTLVRLFALPKKNILNNIREQRITRISATPTYYKLLFPSAETFPGVESITSGGEKLNPALKNQLSELFPNAKIYNIYASTEAGTLFVSNDDLFLLKNELKGKVKVENDELFIHISLLGKTKNINLKDNFYATGDIVEVITKTPLRIRFLSRKDELINIGGYKVNPNEVEESISRIEGITDAYVFSKPNSVMGQILNAEVVRENEKINSIEIGRILRDHLQEFKIPRIIKFVESIPKTRTGKKLRN